MSEFVVRYKFKENSIFIGLERVFYDVLKKSLFDLVRYAPFDTIIIIESADLLSESGVNLDALGSHYRGLVNFKGKSFLFIILDRLPPDFTEEGEELFWNISVVMVLNVIEAMFIHLSQGHIKSPIIPYMGLFCRDGHFNSAMYLDLLLNTGVNSPVIAIPSPN